jgi:biotin synthase
MRDESFIISTMNKVLAGADIVFEEARRLASTPDIFRLAKCANIITRTFNGDKVDVEMLINGKSGACPEDCFFCGQSSFYKSTGTLRYALLPKQLILERAKAASRGGANSFCLVCAYRSPPEKDFDQICETIAEIKNNVKIDVNVSLGFITKEQAVRLKTLGVKRYNHNLETSESFFSQICNTHDFHDRMKTARIVKQEGLELCCGGIIGLGESMEQRLELGFSLRSLRPDEVPVNILIAKKGTPLANVSPLDPFDAIKTISVWRFIMPRTIIKIAGGREVHFKDNGEAALKAGANGIITGGYLTTSGNEPNEDILMIRKIGFNIYQ